MHTYRPLYLSMTLVCLLMSVAARSQNYIAVTPLGTSSTADGNLHVSNPSSGINLTYHGVHWHTEANQFTYYYSLRYGGYFKHSSPWGMEFNYTHNKAILHTDETAAVSGVWHGIPVNGVEPVANRVQQMRFANGENIFALNLLYRITGQSSPSFPQGRTQGYLGGGPAVFALVRSIEIDGVHNPPQMQYSSLGYEMLFGVRYGLSRKLYLFGEAKYTHGDARVTTIDGGRVDAPLHSWHTALGIMWEF